MNVNMKLVVVWGIVIFMMAAIGLIGYVGRDTLVDPNDYLDTPSQQEEEFTTHKCSSSSAKADIDYNFAVLDDGTVNKVTIEYQTKEASQSLNAAVEGLKTNAGTGFQAAYNLNTEGTFKLTASIAPNMISQTTIDTLKPDANLLGIIVSNETSYVNYQALLNNLGTYTCN